MRQKLRTEMNQSHQHYLQDNNNNFLFSLKFRTTNLFPTFKFIEQ